MARRYGDVFGELEEQFPLPGERQVGLAHALRAIANHLQPVGAELVPVGPGLTGRVLAQNLPVDVDDHAQAPTVIQAGTVLGPLHLGLLAPAGLAEVPVRRCVRVGALGAGTTADQDLRPALLTVTSELEALGAQVEELGVLTGGETSFLEAVAQGVASDLFCVVAAEGAADAVLGAARKLGARTLFERILCQPGGDMVALARGQCLVLVFPTEGGGALLLHRLVLAFSSAALTGVPPAPPQQLPADTDLPMTQDDAVLVPALHVAGRAGLMVRPLGEPGRPTAKNLLEATCVIYLPAHSLPCGPGDLVQVLSLSPAQAGPLLSATSAEESDP